MSRKQRKQHPIAAYRRIEARIKKGDLDALLERWKCGRLLLDERGDGSRLPNGRRDELSNALGISGAELNNRMQFAVQYATQEKVRAAFEVYGSWFAICDRGLGRRGLEAATPSTDAELDLARSRRELEEWEVLEPNALDGLSDLEVRTVITELRAAYELYCEDPARGKVPTWGEEIDARALHRDAGSDPTTWKRHNGWYPKFTIDRKRLRALGQEIIDDLLVGVGGGYEQVGRRLDLAARLCDQPGGNGGSELPKFSRLIAALVAIYDAAANMCGAYEWEFPPRPWRLAMLWPGGFTVRVMGRRLVIEASDDDRGSREESP
jgi:hypothetical protein